eukprot:TRINITY_DN6504_c0_g1_i2.p1 TRINITY_DN6504_c0_g1~~TRINITY_DN6504_c0_g1_i2.p1  ORF type:complete len:497 (-),score=41.17 TRINITY_DN6504_c0_g1_i2:180-1670(-)
MTMTEPRANKVQNADVLTVTPPNHCNTKRPCEEPPCADIINGRRAGVEKLVANHGGPLLAGSYLIESVKDEGRLLTVCNNGIYPGATVRGCRRSDISDMTLWRIFSGEDGMHIIQSRRVPKHNSFLAVFRDDDIGLSFGGVSICKWRISSAANGIHTFEVKQKGRLNLKSGTFLSIGETKEVLREFWIGEYGYVSESLIVNGASGDPSTQWRLIKLSQSHYDIKITGASGPDADLINGTFRFVPVGRDRRWQKAPFEVSGQLKWTYLSFDHGRNEWVVELLGAEWVTNYHGVRDRATLMRSGDARQSPLEVMEWRVREHSWRAGYSRDMNERRPQAMISLRDATPNRININIAPRLPGFDECLQYHGEYQLAKSLCNDYPAWKHTGNSRLWLVRLDSGRHRDHCDHWVLAYLESWTRLQRSPATQRDWRVWEETSKRNFRGVEYLEELLLEQLDWRKDIHGPSNRCSPLAFCHKEVTDWGNRKLANACSVEIEEAL